MVTENKTPAVLSYAALPGFLGQPVRQLQPINITLQFEIRSSQWWFAFQQGMKRLFDLTAASIGTLMILPLLLTIALLIKLGSKGPVLYKSERVGRDNKSFYMYKFRTMRPDADSLRDSLRKENNLEGTLFKLKDDPRVTPVGKFLRAYSLDELPQLLNVLKGEMSLVGPRPLPPDESVWFEDPYTLRYEVTPGITGIWQVSGRSNLDFKSLAKLELDYVIGWNLFSDFRILFKTVPVVLFRKGAC